MRCTAQIKTVQCISPSGLHTMAYKEWGEADNPNILICVHGLTRVSDDFDELAQALSVNFDINSPTNNLPPALPPNSCTAYRVICPDVVGRGRSSWLRDPQHYQLTQYMSDMVTLLARVCGQADVKVDWLGTSMGGLIGMMLASLPGTPIRKLVLNDVGPTLNPVALTRIGQYLGQPIRYAQFDEAQRYIRQVSAPFGTHSDAQWHKLAADVLRQDAQGQWVLHYDIALATAFRLTDPAVWRQVESALWSTYDAITCPTLLLRGADSDLLLHETAQAMTQRGPKAKLVEFAGVGHAPTLLHTEQIDAVKCFLAS